MTPPPAKPPPPPELLTPVIPPRDTEPREPTESTGVRFAASLMAALRAIAKEEGLSLNRVIVRLVEGGLRLREWQRRLAQGLDDDAGDR